MKQHGTAERDFRNRLDAFFQKQTKKVVASLREHGRNADLDTLFLPSDWDDAFKDEVTIGVEEMVVAGALAEIAATQDGDERSTAVRDRRAIDDVVLEELPDDIRVGVQQAANEIVGQPWPREVTREQQRELAKVIQAGLEAGDTLDELALRVESSLGRIGKIRAVRIARTEATGALNSGAQAHRDVMTARGIVTKKEWVAITDDDTRATHIEAHGQQKPSSGEFDIGNSKARYPGDVNLPPEERIHCRCTVVSIVSNPV